MVMDTGATRKLDSTMLRIVLASVHLFALGIGLGAIFSRARNLNDVSASPHALRRGFAADTWWGIAALLWISTGLWRAIGGFEKTPSYYWSNHVFYAKMSLLAFVLLLEIWPMVTLIRWRIAERRGTLPPAATLQVTGKRIARISDVQTLLIVCMVVAAVMLARGYGAR
jgi:putative membrane protein